jgi:hypothetical protein
MCLKNTKIKNKNKIKNQPKIKNARKMKTPKNKMKPSRLEVELKLDPFEKTNLIMVFNYSWN